MKPIAVFQAVLLALSLAPQANAQTQSRLVAGASWSSGMPCPDSVRFIYPPSVGGDLGTKPFLPFNKLVDYQCDIPSGAQWLFATAGRSFDAKGRIVADTVWRADNPSEPLRPFERSEYGYAADGRSDTLVKSAWQNGDWQPSQRTTKTYSPSGKPAETLLENRVTGSWARQTRTVWAYDVADSLVSRRSERFWNGQWVQEGLAEWTFDALHRLVRKSVSYSGNQTQTSLWEYDAAGYATLEINIQTNMGSASSDTTTFEYTPAHDSVTILKTQMWGLSERLRQKLSPAGRVTQEWHDNASPAGFEPDYQRFKFYDAAGRVLVDSFLQWDGAAYRPSGLHQFKYTPTGNPLLNTHYLFENGLPKKEQKWEYAYNAYDQLTSDKYFSGQGNVWVLEDWRRYYYEAYEPVSVAQPSVAQPLVLVPNPVSGQILLPNDPDLSGLARIFDVNGRAVWQGRVQPGAVIQLGHLPVGIYVFSLQTGAGSNRVGRFVKI